MSLKRFFVSAISLLLVIAMVTACSKSTTNPTPTPTVEDGKLSGKIVFMTHRTDKADNVLTDIAKEFMAANPGTEIEVQPNPGDDILKTQMAAGEMADISFIPNGLGITPSNFPEYFIPIDDLGFTKDNTRYWQNGAGTDNKLYLLSIGANYNGVIYNKKTFEAAGITELPTTQEEFFAACAKLKAAGIVPVASNYIAGWPVSGFANGTYSNDVIGSENYNKTLLTSDYLKEEAGGVLEALNFLRELNKRGYLEADLMSTNWDGSKLDLAQAKTAMMMLGTWLPSQIIDNGAAESDIGMFPFPGAKALVGGGDKLYGVTTKSENPDLAKAFLKYMWEDGYMLKKIGMIPVNKDFEPDQTFLKELFSFNLPIIEGQANDTKFDEAINEAQIDHGKLAQDYIIAEDPQKVIDEYNKKWSDAKTKLGIQ